MDRIPQAVFTRSKSVRRQVSGRFNVIPIPFLPTKPGQIQGTLNVNLNSVY
jgi:hypothetical protein